MSVLSRYEQLTENCLLEFQTEDRRSVNGAVGSVSSKEYKWKVFQNIHEKLVVPYIDDLKSDFNKSLPGLHLNCLLTLLGETTYEERYFTFGNSNTLSIEETFARIPKGKYIQNTYTSKCKLVNNRFHFRNGYIVPPEGLFVKYKCDNVVFANAYITAENFKALVKFNPRPVIVGTRIYDRYIDIRTLDLLDLANINDDLSAFLALGRNPVFQIEVSEADYFYRTETSIYEFEIKAEKSRHAIPYNSVFDNFNVVMFENKKDNYIEYYPVWGDFQNIKSSITGNNVLETVIPPVLDTSIISRLSNGELSAFYGPDYHEQDLDFDDAYQGLLRWCTVHELIFTEYIEPIGPFIDESRKYTNTRKIEFTETYDDKVGDYNFKYKHRPIVESPSAGQTVTRMTVTYNCRLWNRQDNTQIVRSTSLVINNPVEQYGSKAYKLEPLAMTNFIIYNKKEDKSAPIVAGNQGKPIIKYEKIFVDSQNIECTINELKNENGILTSRNIFAAGPQLNLYPTSHFYKFRFVTRYENKGGEYGLKALDLSGPYRFVLRLYNNQDMPVDIEADYTTENINPVLGELQFQIKEETVNKINATHKPQWSVLSITDTGIVSTLATGPVGYR